MSTDRELLEFAAKPNWAGTEVGFHFSESEGAILFIDADNQDHNGCDVELVWNPLDDDGDALRLAANLHIDVEQNLCHITARYWISDEGGLVSKCVSVDVQGDRISATRIAIVRAAADIGRAMP